MRRLIVPASLLATLAAAFALYAVKYDTRRLQLKVQQSERAIERAENEIDVLKAERAHLARPERIEELARSQGLVPLSADQIGRIGDVPLRGDDRLTALPGALPEGR